MSVETSQYWVLLSDVSSRQKEFAQTVRTTKTRIIIRTENGREVRLVRHPAGEAEGQTLYLYEQGSRSRSYTHGFGETWMTISEARMVELKEEYLKRQLEKKAREEEEARTRAEQVAVTLGLLQGINLDPTDWSMAVLELPRTGVTQLIVHVERIPFRSLEHDLIPFSVTIHRFYRAVGKDGVVRPTSARTVGVQEEATSEVEALAKTLSRIIYRTGD